MRCFAENYEKIFHFVNDKIKLDATKKWEEEAESLATEYK
jgi:hypothetical protein